MATAIKTYVTARPRGGYGAHTYRFEDHGLNEQTERAKFRPYMVRFGVAAETSRTIPAPQPASNAGEPTLLS
jgi:hypothetical protein